MLDVPGAVKLLIPPITRAPVPDSTPPDSAVRFPVVVIVPRSRADESYTVTLSRVPAEAAKFTAPVKSFPALFTVMLVAPGAVKVLIPPITRAPVPDSTPPAVTIKLPSIFTASSVIVFASTRVTSTPLAAEKVLKSLSALSRTASPPGMPPRISVVRSPTVTGPAWVRSSVSAPPVVIVRKPLAVEPLTSLRIRASESVKVTSEPVNTSVPKLFAALSKVIRDAAPALIVVVWPILMISPDWVISLPAPPPPVMLNVPVTLEVPISRALVSTRETSAPLVTATVSKLLATSVRVTSAAPAIMVLVLPTTSIVLPASWTISSPISPPP